MLAFGTQAEGGYRCATGYPIRGIALDTFEKIRQAGCRAGGYVEILAYKRKSGSEENLFATRRQNSGVLKLQRRLSEVLISNKTG